MLRSTLSTRPMSKSPGNTPPAPLVVMMEPGCTSVSLVRYSIFTLPLFANWMSLVTTPLSLHDLSVAPICVFSDKIDRTRLDAA